MTEVRMAITSQYMIRRGDILGKINLAVVAVNESTQRGGPTGTSPGIAWCTNSERRVVLMEKGSDREEAVRCQSSSWWELTVRRGVVAKTRGRQRRDQSEREKGAGEDSLQEFLKGTGRLGWAGG